LEGGLPVLSRLVRSFTNIFGDSAHVDPERRNAVLLLGGIAAVVAIAMALIVYGYYTDRVEPRRANVLRIGDRHFSYGFVERRIKSDYTLGLLDVNNFQQGVAESVARIQREELVRIMARERGISASQAEIDDFLRRRLGLAAEVGHDEMAGLLRSEVLRSKLPLDEYLETVEAEVLETKIKAELTASLAAEAEQVHLNLIAAGSQSNAILAKQALDAGAPFAEVAQQYSQDQSARAGGAFGWAPRELLGAELADAAFSTTGLSGIIETEEDFYIVEVLEKETRPITDEIKADISEREFRGVLEDAVNNTPFAYNLTQDQLVRLAGAVGALARG
jgi:hypothetical protein